MTLRGWWTAVAVGGLVFGLGQACTDVQPLGDPCILVKKDTTSTDPFASTPLLESDIEAGKDYLSRGAVDCADLELTCAHDRRMGLTGIPTNPVQGYCTRACPAEGPTSLCGRTKDKETKDDLGTYTCRSLILDPETIAKICEDQADCQKFFGGDQHSLYCAHALPPDAGTAP